MEIFEFMSHFKSSTKLDLFFEEGEKLLLRKQVVAEVCEMFLKISAILRGCRFEFYSFSLLFQ
jgi:hypothetical protein